MTPDQKSAPHWAFDFSIHFKQNNQGIWHSAVAKETVSFPDDGHTNCMGVEETSLWFQHRNDCLTEIMSNFPPGGTLFDIGGGNGAVSFHLQQAGHSCCLVEPAPAGAINARSRGIANVICGTASDLVPFSGNIPAIGLFDVLEHIKEDAELLLQLYDLLKPGGRLYLTVPAHAWLWSESDVRAMHFRRYSPKELRRVLEESGFEVEYLTGIFAPLIPGIFLFRSLRSLWGHRRVLQYTTQQRQREHGTSKNLAWRSLMKMLKHDIHSIRQRKSIVGASLLCSAQKSGQSQLAKMDQYGQNTL